MPNLSGWWGCKGAAHGAVVSFSVSSPGHFISTSAKPQGCMINFPPEEQPARPRHARSAVVHVCVIALAFAY